MRAAIYLRVSTDHEDQKLSPEHQLATCKEHARELGFETDETIVYNDAGLSGTEMEHRTSVQKLMADARNGKFNAVLFTAISRFARDLSDALTLKKRLETVYGIRIISVEEGYDTGIDGRNSEMIFTVYAMMASHKSREMSTAIRRGLRQSAASGRHIGNVCPYGYQKTSEKRLVPDAVAAPIIREIFHLYLSGMGSKSIAGELNRKGVLTAKAARGKASTLWQASTINTILHNPVYAGNLVANRWRNDTDIALSRQFDVKTKRQMQRHENDWVVVKDNHEAIIDAETFEIVQKTLEMKATNKGVRRTSIILSGLMRCAECGGAMIVSGRSGRNGQAYKYVGCAAVRRVGKQACTNHASSNYSDVLDAVLIPLQEFSASPETMDRLVELILQSATDRGLNERIIDLRRQLERNEQRQREALRGYTEGVFTLDMVKEHQHELHSEENRLQDEIKKMESQQASQGDVMGKREEIREQLNVFRHIDKYDTIIVRSAIATIIDCIQFTTDKRLKIQWKWDFTSLFGCTHL